MSKIKKLACSKEMQDRIIADAIETAIIQGAEISGLRAWLIWCVKLNMARGKWPNEEKILEGAGLMLKEEFGKIIDGPKEFFESDFYELDPPGGLWGSQNKKEVA